jgi:hypothetical protein
MMSRHEVGVLDGTVLQLDGSTEYADQSGLGNDGTNSGTTISDGKFVFDGTAAITLDDSITFSGDRSVSFWCLLNSRPGMPLGGASGNYYPYISVSQIQIASTAGSSSWAKTVPTGEWVHIAITGDGTTATLYYNGVSQGTATDRSPTISTIAAYAAGTEYVDGELDDIRIFNRALSAAEITTLYNNTIQDESGSGNHGVMTNGAYVGEDDEIVFDGVDDKITFPSTTLSGDRTVSFWVYHDSGTPTINSVLIGGAASHYYPYVTASRIYISDGTGSLSRTHARVVDTWYHIAISGNGTTATYYVDGVSIGTTADRSPTLTTMGMYETNVIPLHGSIRDPRIYNRALSAAEILTLASEYEFQVPNTRGSVLGIVPSYFDTEADVTAIDWSGNGNAGVLTNGPTYTADVDEGGTRAIEFDGDNDHMPVGEGILTLTECSISAWINTSEASGNNYIIVKGYDGSVVPWSLRVGTSKAIVHHYQSSTEYGSTSTTSVNDGTWRHVCGVILANGSTEIFVDGVSEDSDTYATSIPDNSKPVTIGHRNDGSVGSPSLQINSGFDGLTDDVYVFDRVLSLDEIKALASTRNYFNCPVAEANLFGDAIKIWMGLTH